MKLNKQQIELIVIITLTIVIVIASIIRSDNQDDQSLTAKLNREVAALQIKRGQCQKSENQAQRTIEELLRQISQLDPANPKNKDVIDDHHAQIQAVKKELSECLKLIEANEERIEQLKAEIEASSDNLENPETVETNVTTP